MTGREKKLFAFGAGVGILAAGLAAATLVTRSIHLFPTQPSFIVQAHADKAARVDSKATAKQQGTQPGTTLQLTSDEMTAAGVQVAAVGTAMLKTNIDAFGRVEQPESQLAAVSARIGGRVDKLYIQYTGERLQRGQPVAELYSPDVATAIEEYRLARENSGQLRQSDDAFARTQADALVSASKRKLELWGINAKQINAPDSSRVPLVTIYANGVGTVVERKVTQGQYVNSGDTLLTLADLSQIWIKADVYEEQLPQIHPGQDVQITSEALPNRVLHGQVQFIEPTASPQTRTIPVHVHLANPGMRLVPGMFVNTTFVSRASRASVVVPRSAVLDTGARKIVYLAKPDGVFEAREVQVGAPSDDKFPVTSGLVAGDKVVLNGNFLIDSQARLSSGMSGLYGGSKEFSAGQAQQGTTTASSQSPDVNAVKIDFRADTDPIKGGENNAFHASLTDPGGKPIADAQVTVTLVMPAMPAMNMPEMKNSFELPWVANRQMYAGNGNVPMSGSWTVLVEARKNGGVIASSRTRFNAR